VSDVGRAVNGRKLARELNGNDVLVIDVLENAAVAIAQKALPHHVWRPGTLHVSGSLLAPRGHSARAFTAFG
jgi:hypothetical protein